MIADGVRRDRLPGRLAGADAPGYRLAAVSGERLSGGRRRLSTMVRAGAADGVVAGVNGDYFSWSGVPSGLLIDGRGIVRDPAPSRSSAVIDAAGALHVSRLGLEATFTHTGATGRAGSARIAAVNRLPREGGGETVLYTPGFGRRTPPSPGVPSLVLVPDAPQAPLLGAVSTRVAATGGRGGVTLPGRLVLALGGSRAVALGAGAAVGDAVRLDLGVPGLPAAAMAGIGGGPALVVDGLPIGTDEGFTAAQLGARTARSAIGQTRDGSLLLVTVRDRRSGPSRGVTTGELAAFVADLGAVTAMGLDSGGSAGLSVLGRTPASAGPSGERAIATALVVRYRGVRMPVPSPSRVSPDGDGGGDVTTPRYRLVDRSAVRIAVLDARGRRVARVASGWRAAGVHRVKPPLTGLRDGRYRVRVIARAEGDRRASRATRGVVIDRTLGHLRTAGGPGRVRVGYRLTRRAVVTVAVRERGAWRTVARGARGPGRQLEVADARPGRRAVRVTARSRPVS